MGRGQGGHGGPGRASRRTGREEPLRGPGGCLGSDGGWDGGREEDRHRGYAAFWGQSPGLSLRETKVTWRDGIKEAGRMTREASVPSVRARLLHPSWPPWGPLDYQPVSPRTTQLGLGRGPGTLTCGCAFVAHRGAGAAAVHGGRLRGCRAGAAARVVHALVCLGIH